MPVRIHREIALLALALALVGGRSARADVVTVGGEVTTPLTLNTPALGGTPVTATIGGLQYSDRPYTA
jgi:hypothetical protein